MKKILSMLMILTLICGTAFAANETVHKHKGKAKGMTHKKAKTTQTIVPKGLQNKEEMPQGLEKQEKTPAGWDQGVKSTQ